jgi:hypothetical protein
MLKMGYAEVYGVWRWHWLEVSEGVLQCGEVM